MHYKFVLTISFWLIQMKLEERKDLLCTTPMTDPLGPDTFDKFQWVSLVSSGLVRKVLPSLVDNPCNIRSVVSGL